MDDWLDPDVARLVGEVLDDLTKYNIVRFVYEHRGFRGDAQLLAHSIGLQPSRRFLRALEELAAAGIMLVSLNGEASPTFARALVCEQQAAVDKLLALPADSPQFASLMRRLTAQSLRRVTQQLLPDV